ncbi:hypothetical protein G6011_09608 [Alternaria panax]|uniref:NAD(P)-binding protein n=1 Tax=Alternaria panax TaxID=48097 RepID=A0AAD4FBR7_9PLEO|nr:hypothetical protein G6011_09608 [Alternaria panax]
MVSLGDNKIEEVAKLSKELGPNAQWRMVDVTNERTVESWIRYALLNWGKESIDGAVNLAATSGENAPVTHHDNDNYKKVFAVNVEGMFMCMSAELRRMRPASEGRQGGSIVNAASTAGLVGKEGCSVYCASTHAVIGLTKAAAREQSSTGIRINAIAP